MIGVGASKSSEDNWYVVCTYVPPGNVISKIRQNVLPLAHIQIRLVLFFSFYFHVKLLTKAKVMQEQLCDEVNRPEYYVENLHMHRN